MAAETRFLPPSTAGGGPTKRINSAFSRLHCNTGAQVPWLDVGANTGLYSIFSKATCARDVVAFEPIPAIYDICQKNIGLNTAAVDLRNVAASDKIGTAEISLPDQGHGLVETSASLNAAVHSHVGSTLVIKTDTLDNLCADLDVAIAKIDVEGFEENVLNGALSLLRRCRPIVFCEILTNARADLGLIPVLLDSIGYRRAALTGKALRVERGHEHSKTVWDYLLFHHADEELIRKIASISGFGFVQ